MRHRAAYPAQAPGSSICPVVLSNETDQQLDGYAVEGVQSVLGLIPAGRSLSFSVWCGGGSIEAYGVASDTFFGDGYEYRTLAELDSSRATRMGFAVADRLR